MDKNLNLSSLKNKKIIGLTGGIASGKTTVSSAFESLGACVVDADKISREVMQKGSECNSKLKAAFPGAFVDGFLDRLKLRELVFDNSIMLEKLNAITHPLIGFKLKEYISNSTNTIVIAVIPLLFESAINTDYLDANIATVCEDKVRIQRLILRDNITKELAEKIMNKQMPQVEKSKLCDYIIDTNCGVSRIESKVAMLYETIKRTEKSELSRKGNYIYL